MTMMTQKQLQEFKRLTDIFNETCSHITTLLVRLSEDFKHMDTFTLDGDEVWCEGDEYWGYGGHEHHCGKFPASLLTLSDSQINQWITIELKKKEDEKKRMEAAKKAFDKFEEERMIRKLSEKYNIIPKNE